MLRTRSAGQNRGGRPTARPRFETLEDLDAPATLNVTTLADNYSFGSLRYYLGIAQPGDTLVLPAGTMYLNGTEIPVDRSVGIVGPGAGSLTVDAGLYSRDFNVAAGATVTLSGMTISGGRDPLGGGGGIRNAGTLTVNGENLLQPDVTVFDDGVGDDLTGGGGLDWYFAHPGQDRVIGRTSAERLDPVSVLPS